MGGVRQGVGVPDTGERARWWPKRPAARRVHGSVGGRRCGADGRRTGGDADSAGAGGAVEAAQGALAGHSIAKGIAVALRRHPGEPPKLLPEIGR